MFPHGFTYNRFESETFESDAFRWQNPDGGEGGIVSDSARIDPSVFVAREAEVWPRASVGAATKIGRGARVGLDGCCRSPTLDGPGGS
jgi:UDP-3-O-[3-hydroxymyristoyl] glucosamine N-acyltransferase